MKVKARYTAAVGGAAVTLTAKATGEDEDSAGDPKVFGTGTIVVNTTAAPSPHFWKAAATGAEYLVEFTRIN